MTVTMPVLWLSQLTAVTAKPDTIGKRCSRKHGASHVQLSSRKDVALAEHDRPQAKVCIHILYRLHLPQTRIYFEGILEMKSRPSGPFKTLYSSHFWVCVLMRSAAATILPRQLSQMHCRRGHHRASRL